MYMSVVARSTCRKAQRHLPSEPPSLTRTLAERGASKAEASHSHDRHIVRRACCTQSVRSSHCPFMPSSSPTTSIRSARVQTTTMGMPRFIVKTPWPSGRTAPLPA